ncbi:MAG: hypothetical protein Kow0074_12020 [Candidatus Zixiibacteriota bacterium]
MRPYAGVAKSAPTRGCHDSASVTESLHHCPYDYVDTATDTGHPTSGMPRSVGGGRPGYWLWGGQNVPPTSRPHIQAIQFNI